MPVFVLLGASLVGVLLSFTPWFEAVVGAFVGWLLVSQHRQQAELRQLAAKFAKEKGAESAVATSSVAPRPVATSSARAGAFEAAEPAASAAANAWSARAATPSVGDSDAAKPAAAADPATSESPPLSPASETPFRPEQVFPHRERPFLPEPTGPGLDARIAGVLKRWFTEGNVPVKIGMLVLFFGVGALLKYAADQGMFSLPVEIRLIAVAVAGIAALGFGWRQREGRRVFALALQGGAIGVLLITVFAAYRMFGLLPPGLAFALLLVLVAGSGMLALLQNALALAVLGSVGGFLAPILVSTGTGSHVALFSYYALLNAAIFAIAWVRPWRVLNLVGFGFTFGVGTLWGAQYYRPEHFATVAPFLLLFFLFYVAIAVLYALRQPGATRGLVDGTLVFGAPLLAFPLHAALLEGESMALAYSALGVAILYAALAAMLMRREGLRTLALSFAALAVGFATLAVPSAFDASLTSGVWALEGAALVWLGLRQQRQVQVYAGALLQLLAAGAWVVGAADGDSGRLLINGPFLAGLLLAGSALFSAFWLDRDGRWPVFCNVGLALGVLWWSIAGLVEALRFAHEEAAVVGWIALSLALGAWLHRRLPWPRLAWPLLLAFGGGLAVALVLALFEEPPLRGWSILAWAVWVPAAVLALAAMRQPLARGISLAHVAFLATVAVVLGAEAWHLAVAATSVDSGWSHVALMLPLALLTGALWQRTRLAAHPLSAEFVHYQLRWFAPASVALLLWWYMSLWHAGDAFPLVYLPLVNPIELAQLGLLALLFGLWRAHAVPEQQTTVQAVGAALVFITVSVATLRAVHHLAGLGWNNQLLGSMLAQTSLTVVWSVLGVGAWIWGSRRGSRAVWLGGAVLMGVVLAKLILIDRAYMGNIAGIVSFLAVGLLLTAVGYFAPSPPRPIQEERG